MSVATGVETANAVAGTKVSDNDKGSLTSFLLLTIAILFIVALYNLVGS